MCVNCEFMVYEDQIEDMMDEFPWAHDTLNGILEWIKKANHITEAQKKAVDNILHTKDR